MGPRAETRMRRRPISYEASMGWPISGVCTLFEPFTPNRLAQLVCKSIDAANLGKCGSCHAAKIEPPARRLKNYPPTP